ncbi:MAG: hypothetical protein HWD84_04345 [Flavobacteriaceae bacterium]|nr:hypothetical protein [Flavobacteriaceae bacterium]
MQFIGNLNPANQNDYQAIYASQLYGTFFSVFAKFTCQNIQSDHYIIEKIDFKLINYKGVVNLGISNVQGVFDVIDDEGNQRKLVNLEVQGLNSNDEFEFNCSGLSLPKNDLFILQRTLKPMHNHGSAIDNSVFDDEYFYREGLADATDGFLHREPKPQSTFNPNDVFKEWPDSVCPRSTNRIN